MRTHPTPEQVMGALLLFHDAGPWDEDKRALWLHLTGCEEATTRNLCELARRALAARPEVK